MTEIHVLGDLLVIFTVSIAVVFVFQRLHLPSIAGFLAAGALIGPHGLNLVSDQQLVKVLAEIGVVLLLFTIGIEFSLSHLTAAGKSFLVAGPLQVGSIVLMVSIGGALSGLPIGQAIFWGCLLSLSSTAIVLKALADRGETDSPHGRVTVGILVFQDLAVVPMMLITPLLSGYGEGMLPQALMVLAKSAFMVAIIVGTAWFAVPRLLDYIVGSRTRELFLLTIIVLCLGIAWLTSLSGLSLALGAFIAGLVISESEYSHQAMAEVLPFRDSFNSLFFVSVGMLMDVRVVLHYPMFILALVAAVLLGKFLTSALPVLAAGQAPRSAILAGISLAQVGEFAFILAQEGQEAGLLEETAYQLFLSVSVLTMVATPLLMQAAPRLAKRAEAFQRLRHWFPGRTSAHFDQGKARHLRIKDHVIIAGYGLNGRNLARVLSEMEIPYAALDLDAEKVRRESKKGVNLYYGDTTNPAVLRHLRIDDARVFVVAISDPFSARQAVRIGRGLNPSLHIVVRTRYLRELEELHQLGADEIVPEEFETSIEIFTLVLRTYKMPQELIAQKAEQVRREGYALLRRNMSDVAPRIVGGVLADVEVESCRIEPDSPAVGKTLGQMSIWPRTGASVIALTREGTTTSNPSEKTRLLAGDIVVLFGTREQIIRAIGLLFNI